MAFQLDGTASRKEAELKVYYVFRKCLAGSCGQRIREWPLRKLRVKLRLRG